MAIKATIILFLLKNNENGGKHLGILPQESKVASFQHRPCDGVAIAQNYAKELFDCLKHVIQIILPKILAFEAAQKIKLIRNTFKGYAASHF